MIETDTDDLDFPVLVPFEHEGDEFLLLSKASVLDEAIPGWERMQRRELVIATFESLRAKRFLGPVESPEEVPRAMAEFVAEGWYVIGRPQLSAWATEQFRARFAPSSGAEHPRTKS